MAKIIIFEGSGQLFFLLKEALGQSKSVRDFSLSWNFFRERKNFKAQQLLFFCFGYLERKDRIVFDSVGFSSESPTESCILRCETLSFGQIV